MLIVPEICIQNQDIFLSPPIEYARQTWFQRLHDWQGEVIVLAADTVLTTSAIQFH
jgi:hypothetical protein